MTILVQRILSRASETCFCVMLSSAEVASSRSRSLGFGATARAIMMRCFWPPEIPPPPSCSTVLIPIGIARMSSAIPAISAASQASWRVRLGAEIVIFSKMLPLKSSPSCSTVPISLRRDPRSSVWISLRS